MKLETAQKLKKFDLFVMPQNGDRMYYETWEKYGYYVDGTVYFESGGFVVYLAGMFSCIPRLDQLLAEIEARGYWWILSHTIVEYGVHKHEMIVSKKHSLEKDKEFITEDSEEAAAAALLWILEQENARRDEPMG